METKLQQVLIQGYKTEMVAFVKEHAGSFEEAIQLALANNQPFSWRAAWILWSCMEKNDVRMQAYVPQIIAALPHKPDGHMRSLLMILQKMTLNEDDEGQVYDFCVKVWEKLTKQPSVRYHALKLIIRIVRKYPELAEELKVLTSSHYTSSLSPGVRRSVRKMTDGLL